MEGCDGVCLFDAFYEEEFGLILYEMIFLNSITY